jgi:hypothetical protein
VVWESGLFQYAGTGCEEHVRVLGCGWEGKYWNGTDDSSLMSRVQ